MKNLFKSRFFVAGILIIVIVLVFSRTSFAQEAVSSSLENQISKLVDTLDQIFIEEQEGAESISMAIASDVPSGSIKPSCMDNYESWTHSNTFEEDAPWNLDFIARGEIIGSMDNNVTEQFLDLNGDGLMDYIYDLRWYYKYSTQTEYTKDRTCVYLNNGNGFDVAYKCYADIYYVENGQPSNNKDFYGDCAAVE
ncbi:hypothetical protein JW758_00785 [Candidatus Peregrinibacteria bacterium]|nr:hypothetical protein [Candidatus Peregrinibacteria bacterium]